jgi:hypothetical protein
LIGLIDRDRTVEHESADSNSQPSLMGKTRERGQRLSPEGWVV